MANRGGKRPNAGRKPKIKAIRLEDKRTAARVLERIGELGFDGITNEEDYALQLLKAPDLRLRAEQFWKLIYQRDGMPVSRVNHLHDKPIEMNVNVKLSEIIRQVRERKLEYERNR